MATRRRKRKNQTTQKKQGGITLRTGRAPAHKQLSNNLVHVFVDDQNLFWGIVNDAYGPGFRIDFGKLLLEAAKGPDGMARAVGSAYIAGVIPDDDTFWQIAKNSGFVVRRGYLGANHRSKQDDEYLITDLTRTVCKIEGPSTVVLVAGDADYMPALKAALEEGWRTEIAFIDRGVASALENYTHEFRLISLNAIEHGQI